MALAAGGRDSVEVRDMAMAANRTDDRLRKHGGGFVRVISIGNEVIGRSGFSLKRSRVSLLILTRSQAPTPIMLPARSALSTLPRLSRLSARPVIARAYHEKVISHYERPRNVSTVVSPTVLASVLFLEFPPPFI
jgi:hypothetical protein